MNLFSAAIVGAGRIAGLADAPSDSGPVRTHAQAYTRHPSFRLQAVVDPDESRRERFRAVWHVPEAYASIDELPAVDAVSICSVTSAHFPQLQRLMQNGSARAILCEKPVCERPAELDALLAIDHRLVLVNHSRRFDPAHQRVAADIHAGRFGELIAGRCDYYGGWLHNGTHLIDTLRMLIGELRVDRAAVSAPGKPDDPCLDVRVFAGGAPVDLFGFDERHYQLFEIDLRFTEGRVLARNFGEELIVEQVTTNNIQERYLAPASESPLRGLDDPLYRAVDVMAAHLAGGSAGCGATLADAAETMRTIWRAL